MKLNDLIVTAFLMGKASVAPGTVASIGTALFFYAFLIQISIYLMLGLILCIFILALVTVYRYTIDFKHKDKSEIVIDEVIGQLISLTPIIWYKNYIDSTLFLICASVILFRFFSVGGL